MGWSWLSIIWATASHFNPASSFPLKKGKAVHSYTACGFQVDKRSNLSLTISPTDDAYLKGYTSEDAHLVYSFGSL